MAGHGGKRPGAGRKTNAVKRLSADFFSGLLTPKEAERHLRALLEGSDLRLRFDVLRYILDQRYGKAKERVTVDGEMTLTTLVKLDL